MAETGSKKYLITGITGFAGPHLANLLCNEDHQVFGLVRSSNGREDDIRDVVSDKVFSKIKFLYGDFNDLHAIEKIFETQEFDGVFHLGAQSHPPTSFIDPYGTFITNAIGTINIAEVIAKYQPMCNYMMCSTSEVYGAPLEEQGDIYEGFPINPVNPYGVGKAGGDFYVRERGKTAGLPFYVTRAFSHTGPRRGKKFSISSDAYQLIRIKKGLQEPVIKVGTMTSKRVVIDVRDCVNAYYMLMDKFEPGEAYNVGGDELYPMQHFLDIMIDLTGLKGKIKQEIDPALVRPIDIPVQKPDSTKLRDLTGWKPKIPLEKTLQDLLDYWDRKIEG